MAHSRDAFLDATRPSVKVYRMRHKVVTAFGASMGDAPDSIPSRLGRGEPVDVVILAVSALDALVKGGKVVAGSRVDLVRSGIGVAVRAGAAQDGVGDTGQLGHLDPVAFVGAAGHDLAQPDDMVALLLDRHAEVLGAG